PHARSVAGPRRGQKVEEKSHDQRAAKGHGTGEGASRAPELDPHRRVQDVLRPDERVQTEILECPVDRKIRSEGEEGGGQQLHFLVAVRNTLGDDEDRERLVREIDEPSQVVVTGGGWGEAVSTDDTGDGTDQREEEHVDAHPA